MAFLLNFHAGFPVEFGNLLCCHTLFKIYRNLKNNVRKCVLTC